MGFSFFIARRYFFRGEHKSLVHRMGFVSFLSVALSTLALLLALSVFNGLEGFIKTLFGSFDPDIKITLRQGKSFPRDARLVADIMATEGVSKVVGVVEDNALVRYDGRQAFVTLKGVSPEFVRDSRLASFIKHGELVLGSKEDARALLGAGVKHALSIPIRSPFHTLQVFCPRFSTGRGAMLPSQLYGSASIRPGGVFAVEKHFDERYIIVPIAFAESLMGLEGHYTALEVQVSDGYSIHQVRKALCQHVSDQFSVLTSEEQQASLMQAIHIERFFVFGTFSFILLVASLNVFFILSMMVLEKRNEIAILYTMGASSRDICRIFLLEGLLVALSGALVGMIMAGCLGWLQQTFGLISLGAKTSLVEAYPVEMRIGDFVYTAVGVVIVTLVSAYIPARWAAKMSPLVR